MVIRPRQLLLIITFTFAALGVAAANNVYLSQTAQGSGSGADCNNSLAASYFNTSSNWTSSSPTGIKIGPGTTVYLCGTITTNLTFQGNGSAGNPVVLDGTSATMQAYINVGKNYWTIQNSTWATSYATNNQNQAVIQVPHGSNGSFGTIQNNHIDVLNSAQAVFLGSLSHDITIQNNYLRVSTPGNSGLDIDILDTEGSYNVTVQGNYLAMAIGAPDDGCSGCHDDIIQTWAASASTANYPYNWTIRYNQFVQDSPGKNHNLSLTILQNIGTGYFDIYSNVLHCVAGASQANGMNAYAQASGAVINIYNNTFVEDAGGCNNILGLDSTGTYNVTNNIVYSSDNVTMLTGDGTIVRSKNLWYGSAAPSCNGTTDICGQNPLFTNLSGGDYSLQASSPAIGLGTNLGTKYNQYPLPGSTWPNPSLGTRPSTGSWYAGAYDAGNGGNNNPPNPPTGLAATVN